MFFEHLAKCRCDALREEDRDPRADTEKLQVGDRAQSGEQLVESIVGKQERITAGKKHIANLGMFLKVFECRLPLRFQLLLANAGNHARAGAVAAVGSATIGHEKQHAVGIAMHEAWHRHVRIFSTGVGQFLGGVPTFLDARDHLTADRAVGIVAVDEVEKVRGDRHREFVSRE